MSKKTDPIDDPDAPLTEEEAMAIGDANLLEIVSGGGKVTRRVTCTGCGKTSDFTYEAADANMIIKIMEFWAKRKTAGADDAPKKAKLTLDWFREATDEELAVAFHAED